MCQTCGCDLPDHLQHASSEHDVHTVAVLEGLKAHNDAAARHNRAHFDRAGLLVVNLMSSPGAGKTRLLEATIEALGGRHRLAVIEGDLETENDARRIRAKGVPAVQITTGSACHLDATMVHRALHELPLEDLDILFIENVGNLVCPASFDLGQHASVTLLSTPEGDDKPLKYPVMFRASDLVPRTPLMYEPSLVIVVQGRKIGYLGDREIHYDPGQYLVQSLPLPFECETFATPDAPLLGLSVRIDPAMLSELVLETGRETDLKTGREAEIKTAHEKGRETGIETALDISPPGSEPLPMASVAMTASMQEAVVRLLRALNDPLDARVMGEARVREVIFEALKGEQGPALRALVHHQGHYSQIIKVLAQMHADVTQDASVEVLARDANMSVSSFHQHFKQITRATPLQYLKRLRLIKARLLLSHDDLNVNQTADAVGYRSVAQFSRDYKRIFGASPLKDRRQARSLTDAAS